MQSFPEQAYRRYLDRRAALQSDARSPSRTSEASTAHLSRPEFASLHAEFVALTLESLERQLSAGRDERLSELEERLLESDACVRELERCARALEQRTSTGTGEARVHEPPPNEAWLPDEAGRGARKPGARTTTERDEEPAEGRSSGPAEHDDSDGPIACGDLDPSQMHAIDMDPEQIDFEQMDFEQIDLDDVDPEAVDGGDAEQAAEDASLSGISDSARRAARAFSFPPTRRELWRQRHRRRF